MAVFSTGAGDLPPEVGPIRSARESDVALLANWGRVALAYSGGSAFTRGVVDRANLAVDPLRRRRPRGTAAPATVGRPTTSSATPRPCIARAGTGPTDR